MSTVSLGLSLGLSELHTISYSRTHSLSLPVRQTKSLMTLAAVGQSRRTAKGEHLIRSTINSYIASAAKCICHWGIVIRKSYLHKHTVSLRDRV